MDYSRVGKVFAPNNMHISMYITDKCNQNCIHCAAGACGLRPEMPKEDWFKIIENIESALRKQGRRGVYLWFGGEPTCRDDIRDLITYCHERGYYQSLITNGINFTEEFAQFCFDHGMSHCFVSLDSTRPEVADKIRGYKGALEIATQAIKNAVKVGFFACSSTTVMRLNIDEMQDIKDYVEGLGAQPYFRAIVKQNNAIINWNEIGLEKEDYRRIYEFKYRNSIERLKNNEGGILPVYEVFEMVPYMEHIDNKELIDKLKWGIGCQAGRCFSGIDIDGTVFPCGYPSKLTLGNALTESYEDILNSKLFAAIRDKKRVGKCKDCHHVDICGGGCRIHAECETGNYFQSWPFCWHEECPM